MNRYYYWFFLTVLPALLFSCKDKSKEADRHPVSVGVVTIGSISNAVGREYVGNIVEREGTALSFQVAGNVLSLNVDNGDCVRRGQTLATVDPTSLCDAHNLSLTTLRQAEDAYRRFEPLHSQGVVSDIKWVEIQTKLEQAKSAEQLARTQLSRTSLVAPFSGVISARYAERGMNVIAGQQIFKLVDISKLDVVVAVPESEISQVTVGANAHVVVSALGGKRYEAVVKEKGVEANAVSHTYNVKLAITNSGGGLMPGMVCNVNLLRADKVQASVSPSISVPLNAVKLDSDNRRFVWLAVDGKARQQYITIGDFVEGGVIVSSGLHYGDKVITDGSQKVSQGMSVNVDKR